MDGDFVLNPLDLMIVAAIGVGMYVGAKRGVIKGAARLASLAVAVLLAIKFQNVAKNLLVDNLNANLSSQMLTVVSFALAFVIIYIVVSTFLRFVTQGLGKVNMGVDNALGALFGGALSTIVVSILLVGLSYVNFPSPDNAKGSMLYGPVKGFAAEALGMGMDALRKVNKVGKGKSKQPELPKEDVQPQEKPKAVR